MEVTFGVLVAYLGGEPPTAETIHQRRQITFTAMSRGYRGLTDYDRLEAMAGERAVDAELLRGWRVKICEATGTTADEVDSLTLGEAADKLEIALGKWTDADSPTQLQKTYFPNVSYNTFKKMIDDGAVRVDEVTERRWRLWLPS